MIPANFLGTCRNCQRCSSHCFREEGCGRRPAGAPREACLDCSGAVVVLFDSKRPQQNRAFFGHSNRKAAQGRAKTEFAGYSPEAA